MHCYTIYQRQHLNSSKVPSHVNLVLFPRWNSLYARPKKGERSKNNILEHISFLKLSLPQNNGKIAGDKRVLKNRVGWESIWPFPWPSFLPPLASFRAEANITPLLIKDPIRVITFHQDLMRAPAHMVDIARESEGPDAVSLESERGCLPPP